MIAASSSIGDWMIRQFVGVVTPLPCLGGICRGVPFVGRDDCTGFPMTTADDGFLQSCTCECC